MFGNARIKKKKAAASAERKENTGVEKGVLLIQGFFWDVLVWSWLFLCVAKNAAVVFACIGSTFNYTPVSFLVVR